MGDTISNKLNRRQFMGHATVATFALMGIDAGAASKKRASIKQVGHEPHLGQYAEVRGLHAGAFQPSDWQAGTLNWLFEQRAPLIEPAAGRYRNIYAPTLIPERGGYRIYYGGWDGVPTPNDRVYTQWTPDFRRFEGRRLIIDHGAFIHVNNCSALRIPSGAYRMMCTAYPDQNNCNKPAAFTSPNGEIWDHKLPYQAQLSDLIEMEGYPNYAHTDINGTNVILYEDGRYRLFFNDTRLRKYVYQASSTDFKRFRLDGPTLATDHGVNDVKKFMVNGRPWYLMALHMNTDRIWYSLSQDEIHFSPEQVLTLHQGAADRYIVAVGLVADSKAVYGVLYGAGAIPALDENRIFAKWLQKRVVFEASGGNIEPDSAFGPDAARIAIPDGSGLQGRFAIYAEDGQTALLRSKTVRLQAGEIWRLDGLLI